MSKLKSLAEHNAERQREHNKLNNPRPTPSGVACPKCGGELIDVAPNITLTSDPPQKDILCPKCGYAGRRIA